MTRIGIGWLFLAASGAALAQSKEERGKQVVNEAIEALGGQRFLAMKDRTEAGRVYSFYRGDLSGLAVAKVYTRYVNPPEGPQPGSAAVRERQSFGKDDEDYAVLFTGDAAYQVTFRGAKPLPDDVIERYRESALRNIFYILKNRLNEPGLLIESAGSDVWANQPVEMVDITDSRNRTVTVYFHRSLKVPVRQLTYRRDTKTKQRTEEITEFGKYRDVKGVQWPFTIRRLRDGEKIFEGFFESVTINSGLPDKLFTLPSQMKILKKDGS
jgi:hypothetical protein